MLCHDKDKPFFKQIITAAQLIEILLKFQYGQVQYLKLRGCNFLLKEKCVTQQHYNKGL